MSYRVCLPTAGTGSRLGSATRYINKSLITISLQPSISRIINQFPDDTEWVIPLGCHGDQVRDFLELAYPNRTFFFANVNPYEGPKSGLGLSILSVRQFLQQPFIFISCDTLVSGSIPSPDTNWMGFAKAEQIDSYRCLSIENGSVKSLLEKGEGLLHRDYPYIGIAGISDYSTFWNAMETGGIEAITQGESWGLRSLIPQGIQAIPFEWWDTGTPLSLENTRRHFQSTQPHDAPHILEKENEAIWFIDDHVIKFSADSAFIANRVQRTTELGSYVPQITGVRNQFYQYKRVEGDVLASTVTRPVFEQFLEFSKGFWEPHALSEAENSDFRTRCLHFYKDKTEARIQQFYTTFNRNDMAQSINDTPMPLLSELMQQVPWELLSNGLPVRYHGDFHFENILHDRRTGKFTLLDWRQDFAGLLKTGDQYYDFAKLLHGILVSHEMVDRNLFKVEWSDSEIRYEILRSSRHVECEHLFETWLTTNGYSVFKVRLLTAIVYLNIAALHHYPYSLFLFALGKDLLAKTLQENGLTPS